MSDSSGDTVLEISLDDVDETTALRVYDAQFEGCHNVNADEDPRPCISYYVTTDFGIACLCRSFSDGYGTEAYRLAVPNLGHIPDRERESLARHADRKRFDLVDAKILPSQRDPHGKNPVMGLRIELVAFGFDVKPWAERECAKCGLPTDATTADRSPDGWVHQECNPSRWDDASLDAFSEGEARCRSTELSKRFIQTKRIELQTNYDGHHLSDFWVTGRNTPSPISWGRIGQRVRSGSQMSTNQ